MDHSVAERLAVECAVREVLTRFCRGIDRCDAEPVRARMLVKFSPSEGAH
jgi:hypothetical protein